MLRLEPILTTEYLDDKKEISKIDFSPCGLNNTVAYDINSIKIKFCKSQGIQQMQSVNALIFTKGGKLLLVEFKRSDPDRIAAIRCVYFIQSFTQELPHKIDGSKELLDKLCIHHEIVPETKPISSIFLVNLSNKDYQTYMSNNVRYRGISFSGMAPQKPAILNCHWFEEYLKTA